MSPCGLFRKEKTLMLIRGPFGIKWGNNSILDVSEVTFNYDQATNEYQTIDGRTITTDGAITASIEITLLSTDVAALRTIFPQYYVAKGSTMSTGETVTADEGAIDIVAASCDTTDTKYPLDIIGCAGDVTRLVNAKTSLSSIGLADNSLRTVNVTFTGQPEQGAGIIQFFAQGGLEPES